MNPVVCTKEPLKKKIVNSTSLIIPNIATKLMKIHVVILFKG